MENNQKSLLSIVAITVLSLVGILAISGTAGKFSEVLSNIGKGDFGTSLTMNSSSGSYTDGADKDQNLQAIAERFSGLSQGQILQADSAGKMQAVSLSSLYGSWTFTTGTFTSLNGGTFTQGGGITATSTSGTVVPLTATDFDFENVIDVTLNVSDATLSFPASSTLSSFIPTAGQTRTLFVRNATTTAAMDITFSGGTGVLMKVASSTEGNAYLLPGDTDGANMARITLTRKSNTDIVALLEKFLD